MLVALIGVSTSLTIGTGVFAATAKNQCPRTKPDCIRKEFESWSGVFGQYRFEQLTAQLSLSTSEKNQLAQLIAELKIARTKYQEEEKTAKSEEVRAELKSQREKKKADLQLQILALLPQEQKAKFESLFSKSKEKGEENPGKKGKKPMGGTKLGFLWNFLDEKQLSDAQKSEIQLLQQKKSEQMKKLLEQMRSLSNEGQKSEIEAQLQKVNQDFLTGLKKYIPADKVAEYETFLSEAQDWSKKTERKADRSADSNRLSSAASEKSKKRNLILQN